MQKEWEKTWFLLVAHFIPKVKQKLWIFLYINHETRQTNKSKYKDDDNWSTWLKMIKTKKQKQKQKDKIYGKSIKHTYKHLPKLETRPRCFCCCCVFSGSNT